MYLLCQQSINEDYTSPPVLTFFGFKTAIIQYSAPLWAWKAFLFPTCTKQTRLLCKMPELFWVWKGYPRFYSSPFTLRSSQHTAWSSMSMLEGYRKLSQWMTYSVSKNSKSLEEKVIVIRENLRSATLNRRSKALNVHSTTLNTHSTSLNEDFP